MKRTILSMMLAAVAIGVWAANDGKTLKMKLDLFDFGDTVVVLRPGKDELTFTGKNGKFEFQLQIDSVSPGMLIQPKLLRGDMEDARIYSVPLVGGEEVRVWNTDKERYDVDGTGFYADFHKVDLFNENASKEPRENAAKYREMKANSTIGQEELSKFYKEVYEPSYNRYQQALTDYVKAHSKQEATIMLLKEFDGFDKKKEAYQMLDASVREGRMKPIYDRIVKDEEERLIEEAEKEEGAKKQAEGIEAPVFTLDDINGQPLALTSLRGKYVILDFWGSWCV